MFSSRAMMFVSDIWILSARDENSGMTMGGTPFPRLCGGGSFRSGMQSPTGAEIWICQAELGGTHSQAELGNDKGGRQGGRQGGLFCEH